MMGKTYWKEFAIPALLFGCNIINLTECDVQELQIIESGAYQSIFSASSYSPVCTLRGEIDASSMKAQIIKGMIRNISSKMRAVRVNKFGGIQELVVSNDLPIPDVKHDQILINVKSSGVNPVDTYIREGLFSALPPLPYTPSSDGAGIVEKVGSSISKYKQGDRVFCSQKQAFGTLAEYTSMNEANVFLLPENLSFDEGAAIGVPYFTAYRALILKAKAQKGFKVLIHGASGAVGIASVQLAKAFGMTVIGTAGTEIGMELVRKVGADAAYNHRDKGYHHQMKTEQGGFDTIIEMLANVNLQDDLSMMNKHGTIVIVGSRGDIKISPRLLMGPELSIVGCALFSSTQDEWKLIGEAVAKGTEDGWVKPIIAKTYKLHEVGEAHHDVIENKGSAGKLVIRVQE